MNQLTNLYFSSKYRFTFLCITFSFLIFFILLNRSFIFLFFFVNMLYIFLKYVNRPTLTITDNELIQDGFYFKKLKINELVDIDTTESKVVFRTNHDQLMIKFNFVDSDTRKKLLNFIENQSL
jgi:hypothetical protein